MFNYSRSEKGDFCGDPSLSSTARACGSAGFSAGSSRPELVQNLSAFSSAAALEDPSVPHTV